MDKDIIAIFFKNILFLFLISEIIAEIVPNFIVDIYFYAKNLFVALLFFIFTLHII
jgi:hypothetical protein